MRDKNGLKFTILGDFHYKEGMYLSPVSDIEEIVNFSNQNGVDFIMHTGDYSNDYLGSPEVINPLLKNKFNIPVYGVYGNHELETKGNTMAVVTPLITNDKEVVWGTDDGKIGDGSIGYYYFDKGNFRIICLDTNYSLNEKTGEWQHNLPASWGAPTGNIRFNSLAPKQLLWLENLLLKSAREGKKCIILSHATFVEDWGGISHDLGAVMGMIDAANKVKKGTVFMVINGHNHTNRIAVKNDILFFDVNAVRNGCWIYDAPKHYDASHTFVYKKYDDTGMEISSEIAPLDALWQSSNTWYFKDPIFATVTIDGDCKIKIEGMKTDWIYNVIPPVKRECKVPKISDFQG